MTQPTDNQTKATPAHQLGVLFEQLKAEGAITADQFLKMVHLLTQLDGPPTEYSEFDPLDPDNKDRLSKLVAFQRMFESSFAVVDTIFHADELLLPGEQMSLTSSKDCGFEVRIIIQMISAGDCDPEFKVKVSELREKAKERIADVLRKVKPNEPVL